MSNRRRLSAIGTAVLLLATASPASAQAPDEVPEIDLNYGVLVALTGAAGVSGQVWNHAASIAVDDIAATVADMGLDTIDVSLVASEDSQGEQAAGIEAAKKLVEVDGANVVIGDFFSAVTIGSFESVFKPSGIIEFTGGTNPGITDLDDDGLLWRPVPSDALQGQVLAAVMANLLGEDAVVNVIARNDAYGVGLADIFVQEWMAAGGTIGEEVIFNPEAATLDTEAQLATQGSPDGWLIVTFCGDWAKLKGPLMRTGAWDPNRTLGSDTLRTCVDAEAPLEGMRGTVGNMETGSSFPAFQELFESTAPDGLPFQPFSHGFDSVYLAFLAALKAGSSDPAAIAAEIEGSPVLPARSTRSSSFPKRSMRCWLVRKSTSREQADPSTSTRTAIFQPTCTTFG